MWVNKDTLDLNFCFVIKLPLPAVLRMYGLIFLMFVPNPDTIDNTGISGTCLFIVIRNTHLPDDMFFFFRESYE